MCGRIAQHRALQLYLRYLANQSLEQPTSEPPVGRYNVPPGTLVHLIRQDGVDLLTTQVKWGYAPAWAKERRAPAINARLETAASSRFWKAIWGIGRCLVPADGWFEWVADADDPRRKQPYYLRLQADEPMFLAAIAAFSQGDSAGGFAIITDDSDQGMVDIHDRRPVVLPPDVAREWLDPALPANHAHDLARYHSLPADAFEWYAVTRAVGNVSNDGPEMIAPLPPEDTSLQESLPLF
ncbi:MULTISPECIES: SOS response-associated peptidase family protein [Pseudomonas]|uniref:SOS response-associated peptidase family protein n=1 Tax=Pseudomonas TaxID=286 RepID=UPI00123AF596|nr:SOS response-associated peptidase family protein [Pseudomonas sp. OIL-1]QIB52271.1 hypothetical protein G3M63_15185 [Pseudomonas sp. OIL-1]